MVPSIEKCEFLIAMQSTPIRSSGGGSSYLDGSVFRKPGSSYEKRYDFHFHLHARQDL